MNTQFQSLALLSGLRIWRCHEPWGRLQTQLGSGIAVVWGGSCSSDFNPYLGTSIYATGVALKKKKKKAHTKKTLL